MSLHHPSQPQEALHHQTYRIRFDPNLNLINHLTSDHIPSNLANNLFRLAKWSSDGTTILTEAEDRTVRLFMMPSDPNPSDSQPTWKSNRDFPMADALLSTSWFPYSSRNDPSRYCFATAVKDHPIQLLDAHDGRIRASYPIVDHRERVVAPHSMLFSRDGSTLYAGYDSAIEIFDVSRPGEPGERFKTVPSRKSKDGQRGIISTLALDHSHQGLLAAGSYSGQIALYDTSSNELTPVIVFNSTETSGLTQVQFHPQNHQVMFSASRKSNRILCWDLRYGATYFHCFERPGRTNQKVYFDVDWTGASLLTGGTDGKIRSYGLTDVNQPGQVFKVHQGRFTVPASEFRPEVRRGRFYLQFLGSTYLGRLLSELRTSTFTLLIAACQACSLAFVD